MQNWHCSEDHILHSLWLILFEIHILKKWIQMEFVGKIRSLFAGTPLWCLFATYVVKQPSTFNYCEMGFF